MAKAPTDTNKLSLKQRLIKNTSLKGTALLTESTIYNNKDVVTTRVPMINVAFSGKVAGGITAGLTIFAGPSKHFKTGFTLLAAGAFLEKYPDDGIILFYDSEFGSPDSYFASLGVDPEKVVHSPITNIEELKFDIMQQLSMLERTDNVLIMIDSVGNLASKKEVDDALEGKSVADMTRAKQLKSLFRMVTPHLTIKNIPMIVVNHTYQTQEMYSKAVVSGGCLVKDTKIIMADGTSKNVQDILVGEQVITLDGPKEVTHSWTPETLEFGEPECYEIEFDDGSIVVCSNHHPFLSKNSWVDAEDLNIGDIVNSI